MSLSIHRITVSRLGATRFIAFPSARSYGRSAPYRRIHTALKDASFIDRDSDSSLPFRAPSLHPSPIVPCHQSLQPHILRPFSTRSAIYKSQDRHDDVKEPREERREAKDSSEESARSEKSSKSEGQESHGDEAKNQKQGEAPLPPPPHGDKSPWQVFMETLSTEFKASKEWNESTKALASSAHQFTENESVKRARAAYTAASDAATSRTASAFKTTGKAIGQSAAWTWDTIPVKGVRSGAKAVGRGLDKVTKPVRETEAFKSVKNVIDDGSSSRYGGWVEKEERRKARELRELNELKGGKRRMENMEEDPK